ncbi:hypothetical protein FO519_008259 [Halicephalobus sp. NKZ332]|nr:hypothetical protein FO519_008259 [Halicephalobus sp. NKZ332]
MTSSIVTPVGARRHTVWFVSGRRATTTPNPLPGPSGNNPENLPSSSSTIPSSSSTGHFYHHLGVTGGHARRESFLYKADDRELLASSSCRPVSRASSVASTDPQ